MEGESPLVRPSRIETVASRRKSLFSGGEEGSERKESRREDGRGSKELVEERVEIEEVEVEARGLG